MKAKDGAVKQLEAKDERKITVILPNDLMDRAMAASGAGLTATLRKGLELVAAKDAYRKLAGLRGKVKLTLDVDAAREDWK